MKKSIKVKVFTDLNELLESFILPLSLESLGIEEYGEWYIRHLPEQDKKEEFKKVNDFISEFISKTDMEELKGEKKIKFINYGDTQLFFVVTINEEKQYALLLNQPKTEEGQGLEEYNNLINLNKSHPDIVIKPLQYYTNPANPQQDLYITPYYLKVRCVGVNEKDWGIWIPEPDYHFKDFNQIEKKNN